MKLLLAIIILLATSAAWAESDVYIDGRIENDKGILWGSGTLEVRDDITYGPTRDEEKFIRLPEKEAPEEGMVLEWVHPNRVQTITFPSEGSLRSITREIIKEMYIGFIAITGFQLICFIAIGFMLASIFNEIKEKN